MICSNSSYSRGSLFIPDFATALLERREGEKRVGGEPASYEPGTSHEPVIEGGPRLHSLAQVAPKKLANRWNHKTFSPPRATGKILVLSLFLWYSDMKELAFEVRKGNHGFTSVCSLCAWIWSRTARCQPASINSWKPL
jgi:hypothetical protein